MKREHILVAAIVGVLGAAGFWLYTSLRSEEDRVRDVIMSAAQAASERSATAVSKHLDEAFVGPQDVSFQVASEYLRYAFQQQYTRVEVSVTPEEFPVRFRDAETHATAELTVTARARTGEDGAWVDLVKLWKTASLWQVELVKRDDVWRMLRISAPPARQPGP